jgi:hypothetical protein
MVNTPTVDEAAAAGNGGGSQQQQQLSSLDADDARHRRRFTLRFTARKSGGCRR